jgi:hypothetical protein
MAERYQLLSPLDTRYRMRLRTTGFRDDEPIDLQAIFTGEDLHMYDTVENCWVKRNASGEWVPEETVSS